MDLVNGLQPGDEVKCLHCPGWHPVTLDNRSAGTEYERSMLYLHCGEKLYFAGTVGKPARHQVRRPAVT